MAEETKAVKITDVRGYTLPDSDRTLFAGSVYRVPEHVARDVAKSGRGRPAQGGAAQAAVEVGMEQGADVAKGGPGGSVAAETKVGEKTTKNGGT